MTAGIEFRNVSKRYGSAGAPLVVSDIDFTVPRGTLTTILGPSGCGKTTTLRMIAGLDAPTSGQIFIDGRNVSALGAAERNVSMVFQSYALFPHMSVLQNVSYGLQAQRIGRDETLRRAHAAMASVGLSGFDERLPSELSGGQQQRVAVARALVLEPSVMLFDEPLSNLDARLRRSMREEIRALQQRLKLTVAYVTHDQNEALAVSDQIIVMQGGHIAQAGTPRRLYEQPQSEFVAGFMGEAMLFDAQRRPDGALQLGPMLLRAADRAVGGEARGVGQGRADSVKVAIRPEAWSVAPQADTTSGLCGTVKKQAYLGSAQELTVDTPLGDIFVVSPNVERDWRVGDGLTLTLNERGVAVLAVG